MADFYAYKMQEYVCAAHVRQVAPEQHFPLIYSVPV